MASNPNELPYRGFVQRQAVCSDTRADYVLLLLADSSKEVGQVSAQRCELYEVPHDGSQITLLQQWRAIKSQQYLHALPGWEPTAVDGKYTEVAVSIRSNVITPRITMKKGAQETITCRVRVTVGPRQSLLGPDTLAAVDSALIPELPE